MTSSRIEHTYSAGQNSGDMMRANNDLTWKGNQSRADLMASLARSPVHSLTIIVSIVYFFRLSFKVFNCYLCYILIENKMCIDHSESMCTTRESIHTVAHGTKWANYALKDILNIEHNDPQYHIFIIK